VSPPPPSRAPRISAALLIAVMLLVPLGALLVIRSLVSDWTHLGALTEASAKPASTDRRAEEPAPALRGKIVDSDGNQVNGVTVHLVSTATPPAVLAETKSNREGAFAFANVEPGSVRVSAEHEPEGVTTTDLVVKDEATTDVLLVLSAAEAIHGTVVDGDDHPIAGVVVTAVGVPWEVPAATSDAAGEFKMVSVPHEATSLLATARGYATTSASLAARAQSTEATEHVVRLRLAAAPPIRGDVLDAEGRPVSARVTACEGERYGAETLSGKDGSFELPPSTVGCAAVAFLDGFAPSEEVALAAGGRVTLRLQAGGSIEGVVVDDHGSAIASFTVGVESFSAARGKSIGRRKSQSFEDPRGSFRLESLAPGTYVLTATAESQPPARSEPVAVAGGAPTKGVRIVLSAGGVVAGHVYDDQHAPLEGVDLAFDQVSSIAVSRSHARTDESGAYRLEGAPAGPFTLRASKTGYRLRMTAGLQVATGATLTQDVTLTGSDGGGGLELGGIGATVEQTGSGIILRNVFPGDPADKSGLQSDDKLVKIDGETTDGMSIADALQRLRGTPGTSVGITVRRGGNHGPETIDAVVVRAVVVH
jgi:hypothetical protein